ncbi:sugar diacid recognition domain-containing protein [Paenibacillus arenosi]|uniref:Helix-turn-helix domain-containing protein n=1 Tax=Paenibacillus arenosi TaxID=2774142 RepID=A0ABR9B0Y6_9BACL|nr:sugar diacid recognition domain-containing protein [Paenibacillus arenosi]MBD8499115.1 helix-turn-helix domain-containing protein [Paenibacillus arenosi]
MGRLTKELAQNIVDRTMHVIGYNVNVMDHNGRIIGSGDRSRLHQSHEGALIAIQRRGRFEIDEESASKLQGVMPGTNLVIYFQGEIVGVIGITGDPREVTKYGELVKMTAEMHLEQAYLIEQAQWDKRIKEDFVLSIVHAKENQHEALSAQAERIGFQVNQVHTACLIELQEEIHDLAIGTLQQVVHVLEKRSMIRLIAIRNVRQIVLFKEKQHKRKPGEDICEGIHQIRSWLAEQQITSMRIAVGRSGGGIAGMIASYQSAEDAMRAGRAIYPNQTVYYSEDLPNEALMVNVHSSWVTEELIQLWSTFMEADRSGELRQTLSVYFAEHGELNRVADRLVIHRNTLRYRLQRIQELTGKDPKRYDELFSLISAQWLYELQGRIRTTSV